MTEQDAQGLVDTLADSYPSRRVTPEQRARLTAALKPFGLETGALAVERWTHAEVQLPSFAALRKLTDAAAREVASATITPRMERIVTLRGRLENPHLRAESRQCAEEDASDLCPPITQGEWDQARTIADHRHEQTVEDRRKRGCQPPPPRSPVTMPSPPAKSYAGPIPSEGESAYQPTRCSARANELLATVMGRACVAVPQVLVPREPGQEG
jgi:hypothetical protein